MQIERVDLSANRAIIFKSSGPTYEPSMPSRQVFKVNLSANRSQRVKQSMCYGAEHCESVNIAIIIIIIRQTYNARNVIITIKYYKTNLRRREFTG